MASNDGTLQWLIILALSITLWGSVGGVVATFQAFLILVWDANDQHLFLAVIIPGKNWFVIVVGKVGIGLSSDCHSQLYRHHKMKN